MTAAEVHLVLAALAAAECPVWIAGGWGVDALVGRQTRPHRDLDLALTADREAAALEALGVLGYAIVTDWRPVRVEVGAPGGRWVDLHPVAFDEYGDGHQAGLDGGSFSYPKGCFVTGSIDGQPVGCLSVAQQLEFHSGYDLRDVDLADIALLQSARQA
jgi:lincosamide nucleotidyltransferase A/C/D/E